MRRAMASALAAVAAAAFTGTARAEVLDDNPAAASRGSGQITLFIRGEDGTLQVADLDGGSFTPWRSLGGYLDSGPGATGRSATITDAFVRGADGSLFHRPFVAGEGWYPWNALGGSLLSAPGVSIRKGRNIIDVFWRGADNGIEAKSWVPGSGWTGVNDTQLDPGLILSAPASVSRGNELVDVIVRGLNDVVHVNMYSGTAWSGWSQIPGQMETQRAPAVTTRRTGTSDVFVRTSTGGVAWASFDGAAWTAWKPVPGTVDSGLAAVADTSSRIHLFARRGADVIWNVYDRGVGPQEGWRGWQSVHPPPPPPPPPVACDPAAGRVTAHARTVRYGRAPRLAGRVRRLDGAPLAGSTLTVRPASGAWTLRATAGPDGRYAVKLPAGPTRRLSVEAWPPGASALACAAATAKTRAGVTLRATRRVRPRGTVRFRGRLSGRPVPKRGKLVELQAFDGGRWRTFAQPRSRPDGRYRAAYRLRRTFRPRTFRFRARVRREAGYPYELGYSRRVTVRVR